MSKEKDKKLEDSIKEIPGLIKLGKVLMAKLKFSSEAGDEIKDGTNLLLPEKIEITEKVLIKEGDEEIAAPDGVYKFKDNKDIITVKNGVIKEIKKEEEGKEKFVDVKTEDGKILRYEGETPQIGLDIFVVGDTGQEAAPDGEFKLEDGTVLTVQDGKITNIVPKKEEGEDGEEMKSEKIQELLTQLESLGVKVEKMSKESAEIKKENKEIKEEHETLKGIEKNMFSILEKIAVQPDADSNGSKATFSDEDDEPVDIVKELADFKADYKKQRQN